MPDRLTTRRRQPLGRRSPPDLSGVPEAATSEAAQQSPSGRSERGGAISLWVLLMVPVSAFAAVVAMAGPQRLAAESSVQEAADDLAMFAVAWRDGHQDFEGSLYAFPPECEAETDQQQTEINALAGTIAALNPSDSNIAELVRREEAKLNLLLDQFKLQRPATAAATKAELEDRFREFRLRLTRWEKSCGQLFDALLRDLGYLGVDMGSLQGLYSDSLAQSDMARPGDCSDPAHTTEPACTGAGDTWTPNPQYEEKYAVPCRTTKAVTGRGRDAMVVRDAVYVALVARWQDAGWAAAQVWPDGLPMAGESMGRLAQRDPAAEPPMCEDRPGIRDSNQLAVTDSQGRPVWGGEGRELVRSVPRTALSG